MNTVHDKPSPATRAEAAAWVARLQGPHRTREVEEGLRQWLADDPEHAVAFELLTETWEKSVRLKRRAFERPFTRNVVGFRFSFAPALVMMVLGVIATVFYLQSDAVTTDVGELRVLTLEDGTRLHLNTATRVRVHYEPRRRLVALEQGEALFEVARQPNRPFIVTAGGRQIRALGTAFVVRHDDQDLAVTLVHGKVDVSPTDGGKASATQGSAAAQPDPEHRTFVLSPGERLTFEKAQQPRIDRPSLERVTAWDRGQVSFDNTSLADAAVELNRYSRRRIVLADPALASIRVSGIFATGDSTNFALAVARTYHLTVENRADQIVLTSAGEPVLVPGVSTSR